MPIAFPDASAAYAPSEVPRRLKQVQAGGFAKHFTNPSIVTLSFQAS